MSEFLRYGTRNRPQFAKAIFWVLLIDLICTSDDVLSFYLDQGLHPFQVAFIRFFINMVSVLPWMLPRGSFYFKTKQLGMHFWRGAIGALAIGSMTLALLKMPLMKNTCLSFTEPLFFLPLGAIFLKEHVTGQRIVCSLLGMLGIVAITYQDFATFNYWALVSLFGAFSFAVITVIARKMADEEPLVTMLFYFGLVTSLVFLVPALSVWKPVGWLQLGLLLMLGINGNLVQVCMFQAFKCSEISAFMPLRYVEAIFTFAAGFFLFHQVPPLQTWIGGSLITLGALWMTLIERRQDRVKNDTRSLENIHLQDERKAA